MNLRLGQVGSRGLPGLERSIRKVQDEESAGDIQSALQPAGHLTQDEERDQDDRPIAEKRCKGCEQGPPPPFGERLRDEKRLKWTGLSSGGQPESDPLEKIDQHGIPASIHDVSLMRPARGKELLRLSRRLKWKSNLERKKIL
jgi:hypothetical protein